MPAPFELLNGPAEVYIVSLTGATPAEPEPNLLSEPPGGNWDLLGVAGSKDISEDGITITGLQTVTRFRGLGSTATRKMFRTEEDITVNFMLADASIENLARAMNDAAITLTADGRRMVMAQGADVAQFSLLVKLPRSAYGDFPTQFWFPRCSHDANIETKIVKGVPIMYQYNFYVLDDTDYGVGAVQMGDGAGS